MVQLWLPNVRTAPKLVLHFQSRQALDRDRWLQGYSLFTGSYSSLTRVVKYYNLLYGPPQPLGGLGFDPYRIGIMVIWGLVVSAIIQTTCLGPIIRRIGPRNMLIAGFTSWVAILALYPLLNFFAQNTGGADARVWKVLSI